MLLLDYNLYFLMKK